VPVLFLSGESDPFAKTSLLHHAIDERLPAATVVTYPKIGHSLKPVLEDVLDQAADFIMGLVGQESGR
jgi:pimeloyl-ACP methyl ester carboxylesterase